MFIIPRKGYFPCCNPYLISWSSFLSCDCKGAWWKYQHPIVCQCFLFSAGKTASSYSFLFSLHGFLCLCLVNCLSTISWRIVFKATSNAWHAHTRVVYYVNLDAKMMREHIIAVCTSLGMTHHADYCWKFGRPSRCSLSRTHPVSLFQLPGVADAALCRRLWK